LVSRKSQFDVECHPIDAGLLAWFKRVQFKISDHQLASALAHPGVSAFRRIDLLL